MKLGVSSLNPYAASYIPLSKRVADGRTHDKTDQHQHLLDSSNAKKLSTPEAFVLKSQPASSSYSSSSQNVAELTDKQLPDEEFDMDIECLRMAFPGISDQSLADVYTVNRGDLDAAIHMLSQLKIVGVESSGNLPETLDIGDVSEPGLSVESASLKLKNVVTEASTSSSSPVASADVS